MPYTKLAEVALKAASAGADIVRRAAGLPPNIEHKGKYDLVTKTDKRSEEKIISIIRDSYPNHTIYAEESGTEIKQSDYEWFIDPLDGTTNFVHNYPSFAVSLGVHHLNKPVAAYVIECNTNDIFSAIAGKGAYRNDQKISVSRTDKLEQSLLVTGFDYDHGDCWQMNMKLHKHFTNLTQGVRRLGAAAVDLCHVATGQVDGFWEFNLNPWDSSAGILIIQEAGGIVSRMDGKTHSVFNNNLVAANPKIHAQILHEMKNYHIKPVLK